MKKSLIPISIIIFIYFLGLVTGTYKLFPYYHIQSLKNKLELAFYKEPEKPKLILKKKSNIVKSEILKVIKLPQNITLKNSTPLNHFYLNWDIVENDQVEKLAFMDVKDGNIYYLNQHDKEILKKLNLNKSNIENNGGIKSYFEFKNTKYAYVAFQKDYCAKASIFDISSGIEVVSFPCLPEYGNHDLNSTGGAFISLDENKFLLSVGTPNSSGSKKIEDLAQNPSSPYGKFLLFEINKENKLDYTVFSLGHRNPQGAVIVYDRFFSVEHGPKGGDEINIIKKGKNYGWPDTSIGSQYNLKEISKDMSKSQSPLFAFNPSIGISQIHQCPSSYEKYYKPLKCLAVGSMRGNSIFLLLITKDLTKVLSVEKINFETRIRKFKFIEDNLYIGTDFDGLIVGSIEKINTLKDPFKYYKKKN